MRIYRSLDEATGFGPCALTIGNFDGVHTGHRELFLRVCDAARRLRVRPSALTFDPHPARVVAPDRAPKLLTTLDERCRLMAAEGIEQVLILPFTGEVAALPPEAFIERILVEHLGTRAVVVGANFRFGRGQAGGTATLEAAGRVLGFEVDIAPPVWRKGRIVSSSAVRRAVEAGRMAEARHLLARPFTLSGEIVRGHGVGSKQTVPTLNLAWTTGVLPPSGVYVTCSEDPHTGRRWPSVTNVGMRPTFNGKALTVETFLLRPLDGTSPSNLRLAFLRRLRDERKFPSPEALKAQILADVRRAERYFRRLPRLWHTEE
ncbi:MAG: bifunctional riboflavin kinase/FAD synthetase [Bryobacterales bacterium]|nr:bifunctional riboflavin kinase/FAD synthetase [Bryobacterales bacterium]